MNGAQKKPPCILMFSAAFALLVSIAASGCGLGELQTARPTPPGKVDITIGGGFIHNKNIQARDGDLAPGNFPLILNSRWGLMERMDLGVKLFMMSGAAADLKVNVMPPRHPLAISLSAGVGAASDIYSPKGSWVLNAPLTAHLSYDFLNNRLTPYAAVGYSTYWVFGRESNQYENDGNLASRTGSGDGLVKVNAGLQIRVAKQAAFLFEYDYTHQVVNDPGDFYTFVDNHMVLLGFTFQMDLKKAF